MVLRAKLLFGLRVPFGGFGPLGPGGGPAAVSVPAEAPRGPFGRRCSGLRVFRPRYGDKTLRCGTAATRSYGVAVSCLGYPLRRMRMGRLFGPCIFGEYCARPLIGSPFKSRRNIRSRYFWWRFLYWRDGFLVHVVRMSYGAK